MLSKLISVIRGERQPQPFDRDRWEAAMSRAVYSMEARQLRQARAGLSRLLTDDMPDDCRLQTTYHLGMTMLWQGETEQAESMLERTADLAEALGDLSRAVSPLNMWAKSLEIRGESDAAARVRERHLKVTSAVDHLAWTVDAGTGDVIHTHGNIRFPTSFGALLRAERSFEASDGMDGTIFYRTELPRRVEARVTIWIGSLDWDQSLHRLSDEAVLWLGLEGSDFLYGNFEVGQPPHTGVRRLWQDVEREGAIWRLETFFIPYGDTHIGFRVASVKEDYDEADILAIFAEFDWPKTFP